ncbi:MAG: glycosyltransferase family 2 protein [Lachnospiraceae bacterium]|nr:glycosyltransferase family 2 protein [Lachnospiraceae bacterium]
MELTVIIPVHNGENYIRRCLKYVRAAVKDLDAEILVINDGSTDGTSAVLEEIVPKCNNIFVITTDDKGVSASRNEGIKGAKGEYISFVDADDIVSHNLFSRLLLTAKSKDSEITGCSFFKWSNLDDVTDTLDREYLPTIYTSDNYMRKEILNGNCRCWSKVYKSSLLKPFGEEPVLFDESLTVGEDMIFLARASKKATKIVELKGFTGYGYYENTEGVMTRPFELSYMDQIKCWEMMKEYTDRPEREVHMAMAIMLVASKIACLSASARRPYSSCIKECHDKLKGLFEEDHHLRNKLDRGYRIKTGLFRRFPGIYMFVYHLWKR